MSDSFFLDTNILIYSFDSRTPAKQARAKELISCALKGEGFISYSVIQQFLNVALRRFSKPMSPAEAQQYLDLVLIPLCQVFPDPDLYREALSIHLRWRFSFYDALIVAAALRSGCSNLYTEDLQHGQQLGDLTIVNPFQTA